MDVDLEIIGPRMRELRTEAGLRLSDLADITGYISQIERGNSLPSLTAMATLAMALGVEMSSLIDETPQPELSVTRAGEEHTLRFDEAVFRVHGTMGAERSFSTMIQKVRSNSEVFQHFGERFLLVLDGHLNVEVDGEAHFLDEGGTLHYSAHREHSISPPDGETAETLLVTCPALL